MSRTTLIHAGWILPMADTPVVLREHALVLKDSRIEAIGLYQYWCIIDAIPHHQYHFGLMLQILHIGQL